MNFTQLAVVLVKDNKEHLTKLSQTSQIEIIVYIKLNQRRFIPHGCSCA